MILVPFSAYAQNLAVEQVRQCLLGCLAGLLKLLVRASQATFSVDQLVEAQGPRFQGNPAGFQGNPAGECAGWCTGLRRFGMVGLGVCEGRWSARRVDRETARGCQYRRRQADFYGERSLPDGPIGGHCALVYGAARVRAECWGSAESSWTSWDMIDNRHRADQECLEVTDATRTGPGFDKA